MTESARVAIPVWGRSYVSDVLSLTLPAVLASGNLPALCEMFDVEVVIVTESRLFEFVRSSNPFQKIAKICKIRLVPLDDLLVEFGGDYGTILTHALFRGIADLDARMTETFLLFLNADFIVSDGSLRHVGRLMLQGKRLIHAPSFRVTLEDVWPKFQAYADPKLGTLSITSREMAKLALAHKHPTVKARTVNQRLYHQKWMDQFYWYVDEETLIGYQSPVALIAIRPERIVGEPKAFWDYGFVPEAAPALVPHFITDSDDFFMVEPQARDHQAILIRPGWVSIDDLARTESLRATKEHRESARQVFTIHAGNLPGDLKNSIDESRAYMAEIRRRLSRTASSHTANPVLGWWNGKNPAIWVLRALQKSYRRLFGSLPNVGKCHPMWIDVAPVAQEIAAWRKAGRTNILFISSSDWLRHNRGLKRNSEASGIPSDVLWNLPSAKPPFDGCVFELTPGELKNLDVLYAQLRPLIKDGGKVLFKVTKPERSAMDSEVSLAGCQFPDIDISEIAFYGTALISWFQALYGPALRPIPSRPIVRAFGICALTAFAPIIWLANNRAEHRNKTIFSSAWTSLTLAFTVKRASPRQPSPLPHSDLNASSTVAAQ
ncbi:MAG TPA: hypothetical protein VFW23_06090 [Tepidisphaeraceae bacterium]|nr:hypothetical protein [Tepidisphaeraceae bacterium]